MFEGLIPDEALDCFLRTKMDVLVLGNVIKIPTGFQMVYEYNNGNLPFDTILGHNTPFWVLSVLLWKLA